MSIRARKSQYNEDWHVEQEFPCINGLSAWFVIATAEEADEASLGYTEGAFGSAEERANSIVSALTSHARSSERTSEGSSPIEAIHSALSKADLEYSGYSCNGVNLIGDKRSIDAAVRAFHSHGKIETVQTNLRHWRDECGKLHGKLKAQAQVEHSLEYEIEGVILRRLHTERIRGYTLEMAKELAALYFAFRPDKVVASPAPVSGSTEGGNG